MSGSEGCGRAGAQRGRQELLTAAARLAAGGDTEIKGGHEICRNTIAQPSLRCALLSNKTLPAQPVSISPSLVWVGLDNAIKA